MHYALYRKYRPRTFQDVYGQEHITAALKNQVAAGKVGHAYLFTGTRGTGKTTCAKIFARAVNCLSPKNGEPCGACAICRGLEEGSILDVVEIDAASNNGVDDIRDLRDEAVYTPTDCRYKVYIVDEVHMLSQSAFNALLKIMEEPPSHVIFILATTEIQKVPATILSRCQRYDFCRIPPKVIEQRLADVAQKENIPLTPPASALIARLADGALRDALSILDTCTSATEGEVDEALVRRMAGVTDKSYLFDLSDAVCAQSAEKAVLLVSQLRERAIDMRRLCQELIGHYRNFLLAGAGALDDFGMEPELLQRYQQQAAQVPMGQAVRAMRLLGDCLDRMGRGTDPRIELELCLFSLARLGEVPAAAVSEKSAVGQKAAAAAPGAAQAQPAPGRPLPETGAGQPAWNPPPPSPQAELSESAPCEGCSFWPAVIQQAQKADPMLYGFLKDSKAYLQGRRVLIDGGELFLTFMRTNKNSAQRMRALISQVTGETYSLGPYDRKKAQNQPDKAQQTFRMLQENGVPVEFD